MEVDVEALKRENEQLHAAIKDYRARLDSLELANKQALHCAPPVHPASADAPSSPSMSRNTRNGPLNLSREDTGDINTKALTFVVLGASGDLAKKKTYPALFGLHCAGLLPKHTQIVGFARSEIPAADFRAQISKAFNTHKDKQEEFLSRCHYFRGDYASASSFEQLNTYMTEKEKGHKGGNRIFYFAIPPTVFVPSAHSIKEHAMSEHGWNRIVIEKPFGHDSASARQLDKQLSALFSEEQMFRIDHYLGKEMVQNLMALRFANEIFEPIWNRHNIASVQITFKEPFGTEGRGGYFDDFGIIRDVMQNHLIQILALVAMEPPVSLAAEDVRNEKAKLLRAVPPVSLEDIVVGQYGRDKSGEKPSYHDDKTVPKGSITPTYATAVLRINNSRWKGTPFILKCGKALNERKAEVRIQFHKPANNLFLDSALAPNELVVRVQPDEAVYMKMTIKKPGLTAETVYTEMDLSYKHRFGDHGHISLPDAYERLILDVIRGDHNLFVRDDELLAAWDIFTPVLHSLEEQHVEPETYEYGSRGPEKALKFIERYYTRCAAYSWQDKQLPAKV
eukprot:TRINITY_DN6422_c1_g1_i1.p1 TRINITY_DN6422_c1_g1~~TRINITY_DN6422_c1_g1_i1.p1  ORF type:complete len:596 (+),score=108.02 TRINITY_DN6422_c1_g1_i1:96-1790(+)